MDANSRGLFQAATYGDIANVRKYLDLGANIEVKDYRELTSLQIACARGHLDVVRLLLERGANIEAAGESGQTSLILASMEGHIDVVKELLNRGANIEAAENRHGSNSLQMASFRGKLDVVKELVNRGANIFAKNVGGVTARQAAETRGFSEMAEFLRKKEQAIARRGLAEKVVKYQNDEEGKNFPTEVMEHIVRKYFGGRKTRRKLVRRKKQKKGTRRR
jgi:ankyrin repeat protein